MDGEIEKNKRDDKRGETLIECFPRAIIIRGTWGQGTEAGKKGKGYESREAIGKGTKLKDTLAVACSKWMDDGYVGISLAF